MIWLRKCYSRWGVGLGLGWGEGWVFCKFKDRFKPINLMPIGLNEAESSIVKRLLVSSERVGNVERR